MVLWLLDKGDV